MAETLRLRVYADHPVVHFALSGDLVECYHNTYTALWTAAHRVHGYGKSYATPRDAVVALLRAGGCSNIRFADSSDAVCIKEI